MSLPYATTTISVLRSNQDQTQDGWEDTEADWAPVAHGIRAVIAAPSGATVRDGAIQTNENFRLAADPCDLVHTDRVLDEADQSVYEPTWVVQRTGLGLNHTAAGLRIVTGVVP